MKSTAQIAAVLPLPAAPEAQARLLRGRAVTGYITD